MEAMQSINDMSAASVEDARAAFDSAMGAAYRIFGDDAFRKRGLPQNLWAELRTDGHRQTHSVRVCSPPSRRVAPLRPRCAGLTAWTPAPRTLVPALV